MNREREKFINNLDIEIQALITMINDALRNVSTSYCYSVPYINMDGGYYGVKTKNFASEVKKKKKDVIVDYESVLVPPVVEGVLEGVWSDSDDSDEDIVGKITYKPPPSDSGGAATVTKDEILDELDRIQDMIRTSATGEQTNSDDDNTAIQRAIVASLEK